MYTDILSQYNLPCLSHLSHSLLSAHDTQENYFVCIGSLSGGLTAEEGEGMSVLAGELESLECSGLGHSLGTFTSRFITKCKDGMWPGKPAKLAAPCCGRQLAANPIAIPLPPCLANATLVSLR